MGDSQISGTWTHADRKLHISCLELNAVIHALWHWAQVLQGNQVMIATDNLTVVSYINKRGTHSPTLLRLTVELLWLEAQNIIVRARHIPGCLNVIADHLSRPNQPIPTKWSLHPEIASRIFRVWGTPEVDMFATLSNSHLPVSSSGAKSPSSGCSVSGLAGEVNVHVSPIPPAQQSHAETTVHTGGGGDPCSPLEAFMRHYKAAGFSDEVFRLAAAPRRPSTSRMYDDRWRRFARWAAGQGFDPLDPTAAQIASFLFDIFDTHGLSPQTIKGYRTCIGSVLNRTGRVNVHVSPIPPAQQSHAETTVHTGGGGDPCSPLEAFMRHYKAAGFSDEVFRLAAAPRRPSTSRMYDDRWRRFARWAAGQGFDPLDPTAAQIASFLFDIFDTHGLSPQTIKGYRTCIGSVLNRTGRAKVVLHRTVSDMIASVVLQRPRITPVLPQCDLGVVLLLEALSKSPYEPLREASFKHLTLKTVFLLAMASAGRRSELHALRFDQNYIQFKPKGAGVTLYFSPESCARIRSQIRSMIPGISQRFLLVNQNSALLTVL